MEENILIKIIISIIIVFLGGVVLPKYITGVIVGYMITRILFSEED